MALHNRMWRKVTAGCYVKGFCVVSTILWTVILKVPLILPTVESFHKFYVIMCLDDKILSYVMFMFQYAMINYVMPYRVVLCCGAVCFTVHCVMPCHAM